jgi:hypothetical protein
MPIIMNVSAYLPNNFTYLPNNFTYLPNKFTLNYSNLSPRYRDFSLQNYDLFGLKSSTWLQFGSDVSIKYKIHKGFINPSPILHITLPSIYTNETVGHYHEWKLRITSS